MVDVTSKRVGRSNLRRFNGVVAANKLEFNPGNPGVGVVESQISYNRRLTQSVTSYRGKRDTPDVLDSPGAMIRANMEKNTTSKYDNGHAFKSRKEEVYASHQRVTMRGTSNAFYQGPLFASAPVLPSDFNQSWFNADLATVIIPPIQLSQGTTAIRLCEPSRNSFSLVRAIAEAARDFPELPLKALAGSKRAGQVHGAIGDEYLNMQFGILPTVSDVISLCQGVIKYGDKLKQFTRDLGRPVRRTYHFPPTVDTKSNLLPNYGHTSGLVRGPDWQQYYWTNDPVSVSQTQTYTEKYWFAGSFQYYLDPLIEKLGPAGDFYAKANQILGLKLDYTTIWELTPWSWLVDWFFNVRSLISVSEKLANDSLVIRYGYLMRTAQLMYTSEVKNLKPLRDGIPTSVSTTIRITEKERVRSTPYGFGVNVAGLSASQWSILAALALTKAPKTLF
jgi:hypothetical protein